MSSKQFNLPLLQVFLFFLIKEVLSFIIIENKVPILFHKRIQRNSQAISFSNKIIDGIKSKPEPYTKIRGLSEWREEVYESVLEIDKEKAKSMNDGSVLPREIPLLQFKCDDVLLQGETKQIHLRDEHEIEVFHDSIEDHGGILGMGLFLNDETILKTIPVCSIEKYQKISGFGIFITVRVISRATLLRVRHYEPFVKAICVERIDNLIDEKNSNLVNLLANNIDNFVSSLSSTETKLRKFDSYDFNEACLMIDNEDLLIASKEDFSNFDLRILFQLHICQAMEYDSQGYLISDNCGNTKNYSQSQRRNIQELTALSWAVFSFSKTLITHEDKKLMNKHVMARIQGLACMTIWDRLRLGTSLLSIAKKNFDERLTSVEKSTSRKEE